MLFRRAFTLIELLLVIGIIAVLAGIVVAAVNPGTQLASAQNSKRKADAQTIKKALEQYLVANGSLPASIPTTTLVMLCKQGQSSGSCVNLDAELIPTYIASLPQDALTSDANHSGFLITKDAQGRPSVRSHAIDPAAGPTDYIARWPLQDNAASTAVLASVGAAATLAGGDNTATITTTGPGGQLQRALLLDGTADRITVTNHPLFGSSAWTMSAWSRLSSAGSYPMIISGGSANVELRYQGATRQPETTSHSPTLVEVLSPTAVTLGTWYHVVASYDGTHMRLYVNGVSVGTPAATAAPVLHSQLVIGARGTGIFMNGAVADVRLYSRALSAAEIAAIAANP